MSQMTQQHDETTVEKPKLAALLKRALDDDESPTIDDKERYVRDDEDGYSA
jgi:hypothetical protein